MLFAIYMDILLNKLKECGVGCYWDGLFVGAICYADDLILLAILPTTLVYYGSTSLYFTLL